MADRGKSEEEDAVPVNAMKVSGQPDWPGLLKWSLSRSDPGNQSQDPKKELSEEDRKWFMEAMQANSVDIVKRMKEISLVLQTPRQVLEEQGVSSQDIEGVLEELQDHVESIDMANDLKAVGGLNPLIGLLQDQYAPIRARAAEVLSTVVQNNPKSQNDVMEHKGMEALLNTFSSDPDVNVRAKALGAISSLIRNNKLGTNAFRLANGFGQLKEALSSDHSRLQRKALQVMHYLLQDNPKDNVTAAELGFPPLLTKLARSNDADIREEALQAMVDVSHNDKASSLSWGSDHKGLKDFLNERMSSLQDMKPEDLAPMRDEGVLLDTLWRDCFGQPSVLRQKGLLSLPGDDEPPPDVAGAMFQPSLRNLAAQQSEEKKEPEPPLLLKL
ncbi:hsp70 nucleotide exchange factor FES1 [Selaginella moellendorffii]|nr:hsp70 nucleotide exchange factor FES1 [Selaginella moellendorffii]|eukprot:XP_002991501.2 hsp70 nucleotide exchange factor FES1 [Selaginella moellendorffii]